MNKAQILQISLIFTLFYLMNKLDVDLPVFLLLAAFLVYANRKRLENLKINAKHLMFLAFGMLCAYCLFHSYYLLFPGLLLACIAVISAYRKHRV